MRKIVAGLFISLDGVVESPEQWQMPYFNDELGAWLGGVIATADTLLLGRRTYEEFAAFWPHQNADDPMTGVMNGMPKLIASTTLNEVTWQNATLIAGNVAEELTKLKAQPGKNINMTGSATLVRSLLRAGVLDELALLVHPIVVGRGQRLFDAIGAQVPLQLASSQTFSTGVVLLTYVPAGRE